MTEHEGRPYQVEILEKAKKENTIVCLGTGTGKTFISVMLIREKQYEIQKKISDGGKRTFFLVNTVPLAVQQSSVIKTQMKPLKVEYYIGDMGVDFWTKKEWEKEIEENNVLVMTAQIFVNILSSGFIKVSNINLIILDECHNASKKHPYVRVIELINQAKKNGLKKLPHLLGLTASIINEKPKKTSYEEQIEDFLHNKIKDLEMTLGAKCITCADYNATASYATKPKESVLAFHTGCNTNGFDNVETLISKIDKLFIEKEKKLKNKKKEVEMKKNVDEDEVDRRKAYREKVSNKWQKDVYSITIDTIKYAQQTLQSLGLYCTYQAVSFMKTKLEIESKKNRSNDETKVLDDCRKTLNEFEKMYIDFVKTTKFTDVFNVRPSAPFITKKAEVFLYDLLVKERKEFIENQKDELHAIVFVERRVTAIVLSSLINDMNRLFPEFKEIKSGYILGHAVDENINLTDSLMTSKLQTEILSSFRKGDFNVLVSTSVVEEGLDVRKCNLVVRFDGINNYRQYVQSKGRARSQKSKFIVMAQHEKSGLIEGDLRVMQTIEKVMFSECQNRQLPSEEEINEHMHDDIKIIIPTLSSEDGTANVFYHSTIPLLYQYCALLKADEHTFSAPRFSFESRMGQYGVEVRAKCILPYNVGLPSICYYGEWMYKMGDETPKELAKKQLATAICHKLLQNGEICKETLQPFRRKKFNAFIDGEYQEAKTEEKVKNDDRPAGKYRLDKNDQDNDDLDLNERTEENDPSTVNIFKRKIPEVLCRSTNDVSSCDIFAIVINLKNYDKSRWRHQFWMNQKDESGFGIILPKGTSKIPRFNLATKFGEFSVELVKLDICVKIDINDLLKKYNMFLGQQFFQRHVLGSLEYNDKFSGISKVRIFPLKKEVIELIKQPNLCKLQENKKILENPIDIIEILKTLNFSPERLQEDSTNVVIQKTYEDQNEKAKGRKTLYYIVCGSKEKARNTMKVPPQEANNTSNTDIHQSYVEYYKNNYGFDVPPDSPMLKVTSAFMKYVSFESLNDFENTSKTVRKKGEYLVPSLCEIALGISAKLHLQAGLLPYILFRIESVLGAEELRTALAKKMQIKLPGNQSINLPDKLAIRFKNGNTDQKIKSMENFLNLSQKDDFTSPSTWDILQATCTRQAFFGVDLERVEFLGDAVLKFAVTVFLFYENLHANEGELSNKRHARVSNSTLSDIARKVKLEGTSIPEFMKNGHLSASDPKTQSKNPITFWLPPCHYRVLDSSMKDEMEELNEKKSLFEIIFQEIREKSLADCIEALIGVYFNTGGLNLALKLMNDVFQIKCLFSEIEEYPSKGKSAYSDFPLPLSALISEIERSQSQNELTKLYTKHCLNLVEERIGYTFFDKSHLVRAMTHTSFTENVLTRSYQEYEYLGDAVLDFLVTVHIYTNNDNLSPGDLTDIKSVLVNNNSFAFFAMKLDLNNLFLHNSNSLFNECKIFVELCQQCYESKECGTIDDLFKNPFIVVQENSHQGFMAPKILGDLMESLAGAIFLDSGLDLIKVWQVFYPIMQPIIDEYVGFDKQKPPCTPKSPKREFREKYVEVEVEFLDESPSIQCTLTHKDGQHKAFGTNKKIAEMTAAYLALQDEKCQNKSPEVIVDKEVFDRDNEEILKKIFKNDKQENGVNSEMNMPQISNNKNVNYDEQENGIDSEKKILQI